MQAEHQKGILSGNYLKKKNLMAYSSFIITNEVCVFFYIPLVVLPVLVKMQQNWVEPNSWGLVKIMLGFNSTEIRRFMDEFQI